MYGLIEETSLKMKHEEQPQRREEDEETIIFRELAVCAAEVKRLILEATRLEIKGCTAEQKEAMKLASEQASQRLVQ